MVMTRRSAPKKEKAVVEAPEPIVVAAPEPAPEVLVWSPHLGKCIECGFFAAHSAVDNLCYGCHRTKAGFVFNEEKNRFVKGKL